MQHVLNVLHVRGPHRSMQSRAVRRQHQRHILTICVIALAGLAMLIVATLRASDDAQRALVQGVGHVPQEQAGISPAVMQMSSARPTERRGSASSGATGHAASTPGSSDAPDSAAAGQSSLLDAAADGAQRTTARNGAQPESNTAARQRLSMHSVNASLNHLVNSRPGSPASASELHLGADRLSPVRAGGAVLIALDREPTISSEGLLSLENTAMMRRGLGNDTSGVFDIDVLEAEGLDLHPSGGAPVFRRPVGPHGSAAGLNEPAGEPIVVPGDEPVADGAQPVSQSGLLEADVTDHADVISSASAARHALIEAHNDRPAVSSRMPVLARSVPEPFAMPVLLFGCLLTTGRSRRRRHSDESRIVQSLRDARSYKLPPGSSDLTLDQIAALRRRSVVRVAA